jgi:heparosan-N-sulfate-glucuronate 5-epimerase
MVSRGRLAYYRRIFRAYLVPGHSQLTFWHETPELNPNISSTELGEYYMVFSGKANYPGAHDEQGIPMLDYHGDIGLQYNPIAIAQWGLGNFSLFRRSHDPSRREKFLRCADWLLHNLEANPHGLSVWQHHFDWEYRDTLRAPWYSGLAQGQGISLLLRAHSETGKSGYAEAARKAFITLQTPVSEGGVAFTDANGNLWFEEYLVDPPTHILNGFIWAAWGVYDYALATGDAQARTLFAQAVETLRRNLPSYDIGFWSLYEQSGTRLKMVASPFYHQLHIVQLRVMHRLTGESLFAEYADRWERYARNPIHRARAICYKSLFKLCYY